MKFIVVFIISLIMLCGCTLQQDVISLYDRVGVLEQGREEFEDMRIKSLTKEYDKIQEEKERRIRNQYAQLRVMLNKFSEDIRTLNGKLEETDYLLKRKVENIEASDKKTKNNLDKIENIASLNKDRIIYIEKYLNLEPSEAGQVIEGTGGDEKDLSENEIYISAKKAFDQGDLEAASEGFKKLIKKYPKSKNADNAQFWIGEIYYRGKYYENAILEYQKVMEGYPKGNKVSASLLKQGFAFLKLGDKGNARLVLKELIAKHPKSNEAKIAKQKLKGF
ncbi:MAG: tol-pal system protein YbgF [Deltaproteobacteria bacterium]|nr:tol-pal system protein YbgF [Deltaproteobacteria bacterium]MBW2660478.1 tol-pal system protein YbgF [Deltaproteobacteria bacterium]